jgi:hypothetical protein
MAALVAATHIPESIRRDSGIWVAGTSPAMTDFFVKAQHGFFLQKPGEPYNSTFSPP